MPGRPNRDASLRPVPWRRMAWVTWRQHRLALAGVVAVFGAAAAYLLITGLPMHHAYAAVTACRPAGSGTCLQLAQNFVATHVHGVLVDRRPDAGDPGAGRSVRRRAAARAGVRDRHLPLRLDAGLRADALDDRQAGPARDRGHAAAAAFGALFSWYYQPIIGAGGGDSGPLSPTIFDLRGVALPAWTLAAFAIGVLAGILIRRVIPAMFATLVVWVALAFLTGAYLRPHYEAPLVAATAPTLLPARW